MALPDQTTGTRLLTPGRIAVLVLFALAVLVVISTGAKDLLSLNALQTNRLRLQALVAAQPVLAAAAYAAIYVVAVACSLPGAIWLTIAGGFAFGPVLGTAVTVVAATVGATLVFLAARYVLGDLLKARAGAAMARMEAGFRVNAFNYLLVLRLVPLFPFFLVNLAPAFLGVSLRTFVLGTLIGIIPGTFVFTTVGAGLGDALAAGTAIDPGQALRQPTVIGALCGLALLALVPVIYRYVGGKRHAG